MLACCYILASDTHLKYHWKNADCKLCSSSPVSAEWSQGISPGWMCNYIICLPPQLKHQSVWWCAAILDHITVCFGDSAVESRQTPSFRLLYWYWKLDRNNNSFKAPNFILNWRVITRTFSSSSYFHHILQADRAISWFYISNLKMIL